MVVLERVGPIEMEAVQGEGQGLRLLEGQQVREADQGGQGLQVVVVDVVWAQGLEGVQGEGRGLFFLEGQRLRLWTVSVKRTILCFCWYSGQV